MFKQEEKDFIYSILRKCTNLSPDKYGYEYTYEIINEIEIKMVEIEKLENKTNETDYFYSILCAIHDNVIHIQNVYMYIKQKVKKDFDLIFKYYLLEKNKE